MKQIKNKLLAIAALGLITVSSCEKVDFGNTNVNPGETNEPITSALLTNVIAGMGNIVWGSALTIDAGLYAQIFSETQYTDASRYSKQNLDFDGFYSGALYDLQNIINYNSGSETAPKALAYGSNNNQIAVARILKAYYFWFLTDMYGDIPYSSALKGSGDITYDRQENIYPDLINELKQAVAQFDNGLPAQGDILNNGNINKWKKMANSMRLLMALRMQKVNPSLAQTEFNAALTAGVITSNSENIVLDYPGGNFNHPLYQYYNITQRRDYAESKVVTDWLSANNDPRLSAYGSSTVGFPYGLTRDDAVTFSNNNPNWARILAPSYREAGDELVIIPSALIYLARAEAAQRGWTTENVALMYQTGIEESWRQWGVYNAASFATYMLDPDVALGVNNIQKIATQYWLAAYPNGWEAWSNWRRTGFPVLTPAPGQGNPIPRRFPYGTREQAVNASNWADAASRYTVNGEVDSQNGRVWWDTP